MKSAELINQLDKYLADLEVIQSNFVRTQSSIHIARGDDNRFEQIVIELRDLLHDALGKNDYSQMLVNAYNDGRNNYFGSSSLASVERCIGIIGATKTRVINNPEILSKHVELANQSKSISAQLSPPEKVTAMWLFNHVPYSIWLWLLGLFVTCFGLGAAAVYKLQVVQQWLGVLCKVSR
jgi:hypothetical protein